jgi:hypothetical protein
MFCCCVLCVCYFFVRIMNEYVKWSCLYFLLCVSMCIQIFVQYSLCLFFMCLSLFVENNKNIIYQSFINQIQRFWKNLSDRNISSCIDRRLWSDSKNIIHVRLLNFIIQKEKILFEKGNSVQKTSIFNWKAIFIFLFYNHCTREKEKYMRTHTGVRDILVREISCRDYWNLWNKKPLRRIKSVM